MSAEGEGGYWSPSPTPGPQCQLPPRLGRAHAAHAQGGLGHMHPPFPGWGVQVPPGASSEEGSGLGFWRAVCSLEISSTAARAQTRHLCPPGAARVEGAQRLGLGQAGGSRSPDPREEQAAAPWSLCGRTGGQTDVWLAGGGAGGRGGLAEARGFWGLAEGAEPDPASAARPAGSSWLAACSGVPGAAPGRRPRPCLPRSSPHSPSAAAAILLRPLRKGCAGQEARGPGLGGVTRAGGDLGKVGGVSWHKRGSLRPAGAPDAHLPSRRGFHRPGDPEGGVMGCRAPPLKPQKFMAAHWGVQPLTSSHTAQCPNPGGQGLGSLPGIQGQATPPEPVPGQRPSAESGRDFQK